MKVAPSDSDHYMLVVFQAILCVRRSMSCGQVCGPSIFKETSLTRHNDTIADEDLEEAAGCKPSAHTANLSLSIYRLLQLPPRPWLTQKCHQTFSGRVPLVVKAA